MQIPNNTEIQAARDAITADGPMNPATIELNEFLIQNPLMAEAIKALADNFFRSLIMMTKVVGLEKAICAYVQGAVSLGLDYGLRIAEARLKAAATATSTTQPTTPTELQQINMYGWLGEDELGSGEIGLKQGLCAAGYVPLVSIHRDKVERMREQMNEQAKQYGKRIRLCRFEFAEVVEATKHGV